MSMQSQEAMQRVSGDMTGAQVEEFINAQVRRRLAQRADERRHEMARAIWSHVFATEISLRIDGGRDLGKGARERAVRNANAAVQQFWTAMRDQEIHLVLA